MVPIQIVPREEIERVCGAVAERRVRLEILADICRINTLASVKRAGSGHLGSSFSSLDIVVLLHDRLQLGGRDPNRDIFFSSKGHDVPGLYAVLHALGRLPLDQLLRLRRHGGPCGHPDVSTPGIEASSGSLGMGISKAKGMSFAKRHLRRGGKVFVMTGDGELQEGQNYEALQSAVHQKLTNLHVIVDHNKVQTDKCVSEIIDLGDLEAKLRSFGWHVARCDGHDLGALDAVLDSFAGIADRPKVLIADTVKGRGVSFMEHPAAIERGGGLYRWHAGAPDDESYLAAHRELLARVNARLAACGCGPLSLFTAEEEQRNEPATSLAGEQDSALQKAAPVKRVSSEYVADAFGEALVEIAARRTDLIVLDADLSADCRLRRFEQTYPERFIENGIAEQDMVSMAGGLALQGLLPVVNSFAAFLCARANEQIYNNACEQTRIIYVCHYSGLIPAGPGQSHQSVRDISLLGALPSFEIVQPCNAVETRLLLDYAVNVCTKNVALRLVIGPSPRLIELPAQYRLEPGRGTTLRDGRDALLLSYGPVMLHEALGCAERLAAGGFGLQVVNMPWLNCVDARWLAALVAPFTHVFVLEDHAPAGGLGDFLLSKLVEAGALGERRLYKLGVEGFPAWGTPAQALRFHRLDADSLAQRIEQRCSRERAAG